MRIGHLLSSAGGFLLNPTYRWATYTRFSRCDSVLGRFCRHRLLVACGVQIAGSVGEGLALPHPNGVIVGQGVTMGNGCTLYQQVTLGQAGGGTRLWVTA